MPHGTLLSWICLEQIYSLGVPRDRWAKTRSPNSNIKVYIGAPAGPKAAGSGYVDADALIRVAKSAQSQYSSFGGVMLWDADTAYSACFPSGNRRYLIST